jgi:hypothetical protein
VPNAQRHANDGSLCEEPRRRRQERRGQSAALRALDFAPVRAPDPRSATHPLRARSRASRVTPPSLLQIARRGGGRWCGTAFAVRAEFVADARGAPE